MYLTISQTYKNKGEEKFKTKLDKIDVNVGDIIYPIDLSKNHNQKDVCAIDNFPCIKIKDITNKSIKFTKEKKYNDFILMAIIDKDGNSSIDRVQDVYEFELLFEETLFIDASTENEYRTICFDKF